MVIRLQVRGLLANQKHSWLTRNLRLACTAPGLHGFAVHLHAGHGQTTGAGQAGVALQAVHQRIPQGLVAVGRFNEHLGLTVFGGEVFQLAQALRPCRAVLRQVADKRKVLAV